MLSEFVEVTEGIYKLKRNGLTVTMLLTQTLFEALEPSALEQLEHALHLPGLERVIITPDVHPGYAVPIGFTAVSKTHLYPDTVGPDPACSVSLSCLDYSGFNGLDKPSRRALINAFEETISVTKRRRKDRVTRQHSSIKFDELWAIVTGERRSAKTWVAQHKPLKLWDAQLLSAFGSLFEQLVSKSHLGQLGSIGGGNHFLEVQQGDDQKLYVMAHFGSRGLGARGAEYFFKQIRQEMSQALGREVAGNELLYVRADSRLGQLYFMFQEAMLEYATYNHRVVQTAATEILCEHLGLSESAAEFLGHIPHNFIELKEGAYWQRKGTTPAYNNDGIPLLIPGSMATASYVLAPGPNAATYGESVPHGAGRVLSRKVAKETLEQDNLDREFDARGVMGSFRHVPLDESSAAYKDVDEVIKAVVQSGVAVVINRLRPVLVLKGE